MENDESKVKVAVRGGCRPKKKKLDVDKRRTQTERNQNSSLRLSVIKEKDRNVKHN